MVNQNRDLTDLARKFHKNIPNRIRQYLNDRGIPDELTDRRVLGWNGWRITIPIFNREGELVFFKRARAPEDKSEGPKMIAWSGPIVLICGPRNNSFQNRPILNRNTLQGQRTLKSETEEIAIENGLRAGGRTES